MSQVLVLGRSFFTFYFALRAEDVPCFFSVSWRPKQAIHDEHRE